MAEYRAVEMVVEPLLESAHHDSAFHHPDPRRRAAGDRHRASRLRDHDPGRRAADPHHGRRHPAGRRARGRSGARIRRKPPPGPVQGQAAAGAPVAGARNQPVSADVAGHGGHRGADRCRWPGRDDLELHHVPEVRPGIRRRVRGLRAGDPPRPGDAGHDGQDLDRPRAGPRPRRREGAMELPRIPFMPWITRGHRLDVAESRVPVRPGRRRAQRRSGRADGAPRPAPALGPHRHHLRAAGVEAPRPAGGGHRAVARAGLEPGVLGRLHHHRVPGRHRRRTGPRRRHPARRADCGEPAGPCNRAARSGLHAGDASVRLSHSLGPVLRRRRRGRHRLDLRVVGAPRRCGRPRWG